jgi:heme A synthase
MEETNPQSKLFINVSLTTALLTIGLIVFGAVVRVTDSGLGCGNDWPLCDGRLIPPLDNLTAVIEWSHRAIALLIGFFDVGMLVIALRAYRKQKQGVLYVTLVAAGLFLFQSMLGALVVILDLPPTMVTAHLGTAMLLLGALLVASITAWHQPPAVPTQRDSVTALAYITAALTLVIILSGALVRGSGATLACTDWPLCNGQILPFDQGALETVHMMHRYAVLGLGLTLVMLVYYVMKTRSSRSVRWLTYAAFGVYLLQGGVGAMFVFSSAGASWGAAHVGLAATTWALLVGVATIDTLNSVQTATHKQEEITWNQQPEAATN